MSIDGHSSLYTTVFKEGAKSLHLATYLMVNINAEETTHRIYVTYSSPTWSKVSYFVYHAYVRILTHLLEASPHPVHLGKSAIYLTFPEISQLIEEL